MTISPQTSREGTTESHRFQTNGIDLHALVDGPEQGPLVLLLHGFPELARSWRHQLRALADAGYRTVAPDLRGYGDTDLAGPYDLDTIAADVAGLIAALGRTSATIVGHDFGGAAAWRFAQAHPERTDRLVVLNCPPGEVFGRRLVRDLDQLRRSWYMFFFQLPWLPERRLAADHAAVVPRALVGGSHRRGVWEQSELDAYRDAFARPGRAKAAIGWYRANARAALRSGRRRRPPITAPTLVIWGLEDLALSPWFATEEALAPVLAPGNRPTIVRLDDVGHFVQNEDPPRVNAALLDWLGPADGS